MTRIVCVMFAVGSLLACRKHTETPPTIPSAASEEARSTFKTVCAVCHGENGKGDGIAAASLNPKPRDYTDKVWQRSVTDEHIREIILRGGAALGKSPLMPAQPQLAARPQIVDELAKIVRSFGS